MYFLTSYLLLLHQDQYLFKGHMIQEDKYIAQVVDADYERISQDIVAGKFEIPVNYEDGNQTLVRGEKESEFLRQTSSTRLSYFLNVVLYLDFSPLFVHCYLGNYSEFMNIIEGLSREELKKELGKRETLLQVTPIFAPIIGSGALIPDTGCHADTEEKYGKPELKHIKILKKLLDLGADVNIHDFAGYSPLHTCAISATVPFSKFEMAKLLIEAGADLNSTNRSGETPMLVALLREEPDFVNLLAEHGADPYVKDVFGKCAYDFAYLPAVKKILKKSEKKIIKRTVGTEKNELKKCSVCRKECKLNCNGCFLEWYCSAECQKSDWRYHKEMCKMRKADYLKVTGIHFP